ncbi:MAG: AAA family ATPase [Ethanoligenens sp.]
MTLIDCLHACNSWWRGDGVEPDLLFRRIRAEFAQIVKDIAGEKTIGLTGPRGCGKTTLLYQTVHYLLRLKVPPRRVLFFSGDDPSLFIHNLHAQDVVMAYCTGVLREEPEQFSQPVYVLIDEAHHVRGWRIFAQKCHEKGWKFHFIVAAPMPQLLFPAGSEVLRERACLFAVPPLCAPQFLEFYCAYRTVEFDCAAYKSLLPDFDLFEQTEDYARALLEQLPALETFRAGKRNIVEQYLLAGGYPGYFEARNMAAWHRKLFDDIIDRSLYGDILSNYAIKSPEKLKKLLYYIASLEGREQAYAGIGKYLSLNTVTVMNHLHLLENDGIAYVCEYYKANISGVLRKNKRLYLRDCGMKHALLRRQTFTPEEHARAGREAVLSLLLDYAEKNGGKIWYWRGAKGQALYVLERRGRLLPVQFLTGTDIGSGSPRALQSFCRIFSHVGGLVVTRETLDVRDGVAYIPLWML